ncbi:LacI family DNA-binding transcriptional regulator [Halalkalibacter okhensis]|uniref:HTH lacI-type domain-containing protein n=1 Tax=Halalkalibacter okhensis TaxID=333138 RepID=A0A0B0IJY4_9BACI|nr:LacI family DNA-binding transcriptional regulator [Halalkalibacter okhensis]KHF41640.1 hypothetical protein LQ50_02775 [Halalkalibacter okhensis]
MKTTLKDIAERVNVSISTISRVLNNVPTSIDEQTKQNIICVAKELGYRNTRIQSEKFSEKKIVTVISDMKNKYYDPYFTEIIFGIERELLENNQMINFTYDSSDLVNGFVNETIFDDENVGVICVGPMHPSVIEIIMARVQLIISVGTNPIYDIDYLTIDFEKGAMKAIEYLYRLGHKNIGFIGGSSPKTGVSFEDETRYRGFLKALKNHNLSLNPEWVYDGAFETAGGYEAMNKIFSQKKRPTALFTASDRMAYGAYKSILEHGWSIPDDISIVSFDDIEMSKFVHPELTTVHVYKEELGRTAVKLLLQRLDGAIPLPMTSYLPLDLIIRKSCKAI